VYGRPFGSRFLVELTMHIWSMEDHWVKILGGDYYTLPQYGRPLCQNSWWKLLYTPGVMQAIWITILGRNYYALLQYGRPFGSRFLVKITIHFCSMEGDFGKDSWNNLPLHFCSMEGHLCLNSWWKLFHTSEVWKDIWVTILGGNYFTLL
jgi:hypothetical protein